MQIGKSLTANLMLLLPPKQPKWRQENAIYFDEKSQQNSKMDVAVDLNATQTASRGCRLFRHVSPQQD